jgi:cysteinyl-tRNA synthetase
VRFFLLGVNSRGPIGFETVMLVSGRVVFPGILEAERRVDYLYHTLGRLGSLAELSGGSDDGAPAATLRMPKEMAPMMELAASARGRVDAAMDDDLNTPVALAVIGELARAGNELVDLAQKRRKDADIAKAAPVVAKMLGRALWSSVEPLGILQTPMEQYRARTQAQRLKVLGLSTAEIDARLEERRQARQAKDFARGDAIRKELEAMGIEVADNPTGTTWRLGV